MGHPDVVLSRESIELPLGIMSFLKAGGAEPVRLISVAAIARSEAVESAHAMIGAGKTNIDLMSQETLKWWAQWLVIWTNIYFS